MILLGLGCRADLRIGSEGYFDRCVLATGVETSPRRFLAFVELDFDGLPRFVVVE
jgi:hypothetical protein